MLKLVKPTQRPQTNVDKPKILIVDDELPVLLVLKRALRKDYDITVALNGRHALELIEHNGPFAVVVSDMHMPGYDGIEFLTEARSLSPNTSRIMLTGDMERDTALLAVNKGGVFCFLEKPCPAGKVGDAIKEGVEHYNEQIATEGQASSMLANFQDELRAPLFNILDQARLIQDGMVSTRVARDYARQIVESGFALLNRSETILDLVAMQDEVLELNLRPCEIGFIARASIKSEARLAAAKGIHLSVENQAEPFTADLDQRLVTRALSALLSNSVRASDCDSEIVVSAKTVGEENNHVCFEVKDEGCGLPKGLASGLKHPFMTSKDGDVKLGLGLPLAFSVARSHGGYLELENQEEGGAIARLVFPAQAAES